MALFSWRIYRTSSPFCILSLGLGAQAGSSRFLPLHHPGPSHPPLLPGLLPYLVSPPFLASPTRVHWKMFSNWLAEVGGMGGSSICGVCQFLCLISCHQRDVTEHGVGREAQDGSLRLCKPAPAHLCLQLTVCSPRWMVTFHK